MSLTFFGYIRILPAKIRDSQPRKHQKNCGGTRVQVDNRFFVLISKMGFRNINLSFFPSVFMCSRHFLFLLEHCQHKWEYTIKTSQSSGARAPELWCPLIFLGISWWCTHIYAGSVLKKNRKCQEHINTLRKKEKLIFLKPILDIKTKTCWSSWKGTKVLVTPAFLAGLSWKNMPTNAGNVSIKPGNIRNTIVCLAKKSEFNISDTHFNIHNNTGAERAPEFWCPLFLHG